MTVSHYGTECVWNIPCAKFSYKVVDSVVWCLPNAWGVQFLKGRTKNGLAADHVLCKVVFTQILEADSCQLIIWV